MYQTFREVVEATKQKYAGVTSLSKGRWVIKEDGTEAVVPVPGGTGGCFYEHSANGVGCAIGCHFTAYQASKLDNEEGHGNLVSSIAQSDWGYALLRQKFADAITIEQLTKLQQWHDRSFDVAEFIAKLDDYLEATPA